MNFNYVKWKNRPLSLKRRRKGSVKHEETLRGKEMIEIFPTPAQGRITYRSFQPKKGKLLAKNRLTIERRNKITFTESCNYFVLSGVEYCDSPRRSVLVLGSVHRGVEMETEAGWKDVLVLIKPRLVSSALSSFGRMIVASPPRPPTSTCRLKC